MQITIGLPKILRQSSFYETPVVLLPLLKKTLQREKELEKERVTIPEARIWIHDLLISSHMLYRWAETADLSCTKLETQ